MSKSGYTHCACRDCFETAVSDDMANPDLCNDCEDAGCDADGESECQGEHSYGGPEFCEYCVRDPEGCSDHS